MQAFTQFIQSEKIHWLDTFLVVLNAVIITFYNLAIFSSIPNIYSMLGIVSYGFLYFFILLEFLRFITSPKKFFHDHRNIFTLFVLGVAVSLKNPDLTILLIFSSLRTLRLINYFPKTRHLIDALFHALPGVINLIVLILVSYFVFAVLATNMYGEKVPELWGSIPQSLLSLQQIMLGDDWGNNLRATLKHYPYAWLFSTVFLVLTSFVLLNVFVGVIVDSMQAAEEGNNSDNETIALKKELSLLRKELQKLQDTCTNITVSLSKKNF